MDKQILVALDFQLDKAFPEMTHFCSIASRAREVLKKKPGRVAFSEGEDARVLTAALSLLTDKLMTRVILTGHVDRKLLTEIARTLSFDVDAAMTAGHLVCHDDRTAASTHVRNHVQKTQSQRGHNAEEALRRAEEAVKKLQAEPMLMALGQAGHLLATDQCEAVVAGAVAATAQVIRAALLTVDMQTGVESVSGSFIMDRPAPYASGSGENAATLPAATLVFADCGVMIDPTAEQLADVAAATLPTWQLVQKLAATATEARLAFLSFSTRGSASHARQQKMRAAFDIFHARWPNVSADGEMQFDAAFVPSVAARKAPQSPLHGNANCFIFPDLDAGNIAYKITERLGGFRAYGPLLQGLARPFSDLSRGANAEDIATSVCLNVIRGRHD